MTTITQTPQPVDVIKDELKLTRPYRLWFRTQIVAGKPIVILVHGAVVPIYIPDYLNTFHDPKTINNTNYCFYDLDCLLYKDFKYNIFTFEYADEPFLNVGNINYHILEPYSKCLSEAIEFAKKYNEQPDITVGPVTIIAHSMGGLIARCAAKMADGTISKIITLDTGHCGFELADFINKIVQAVNQIPTVHITSPPSIDYQDEVKEGSDFMKKLNDGFKPDNPKLVSLGARNPVDISSLLPMPFPPLKIMVTGLHSASMGQVNDSGQPTTVNHNLEFYPLNCNHANIMRITFDNCQNHEAYQIIKKVI